MIEREGKKTERSAWLDVEYFAHGIDVSGYAFPFVQLYRFVLFTNLKYNVMTLKLKEKNENKSNGGSVSLRDLYWIGIHTPFAVMKTTYLRTQTEFQEEKQI